jgi:hypothetical protein
MPSNPVTPDQFKAVIPASNSNICQKLLSALVEFPVLFYKWYSWAFNADGTVSDDFKTAIGVTVGQLTPPGGVSASDGTFTDHVHIVWNPVGGATFYEVYRGATNDSSSATLLGTTTAPVTTYDDATAVDGQVYWYFLKAKTATDSSGFSTGDSGYRDTGGGGGLVEITFHGNGSYIVPAGAATITVEAWGAGAGGGSSACSFCPAGADFYGGGGGGSGEYLKATLIPVTPGETLSVFVDGGGAAGNLSGGKAQNGVDGGPSLVKRISTILTIANGGGGGTAGSTGAKNGAGGAGGTGGFQTGGTLDTQTPGTAGTGGTQGNVVSPPGTGGTGGAQNTGGGNQGGNGAWNGTGTAGAGGTLKITPVA